MLDFSLLCDFPWVLVFSLQSFFYMTFGAVSSPYRLAVLHLCQNRARVRFFPLITKPGDSFLVCLNWCVHRMATAVFKSNASNWFDPLCR